MEELRGERLAPSAVPLQRELDRGIVRNLLEISLEKPELAGVALLILLAALFEARSAGAFLSADNLRGVLGLLPEVGVGDDRRRRC